MNASTHACQSCGMSIDSGVFCRHCTGADGQLQPFEERFERMVQWQLRQDPALDRAAAERQTRAYMRTMPAWAAHPRLRDEG